jgi:hypothetical protein
VASELTLTRFLVRFFPLPFFKKVDLRLGVLLQVLTRVRGGRKKKVKASDLPQKEAAEQDVMESETCENVLAADADGPSLLKSVDPEGTDLQTTEANLLVSDGEVSTQEMTEGGVDKNDAAKPPEENEEDEAINTSAADTTATATAAAAPAADYESDDSERERQNRTKEVNLDIKAAVDKFANNILVRNYCWLLKFYSTNRASINHYIVRMLQRICEDCMLEPMLYQVPTFSLPL